MKKLQLSKQQLISLSFAIVCGITAFSISYLALSLLLEPLEEIVEKKIKNGGFK